ncbi:low specificity L-threonine aldolase [Variibacter gotjawalensis]|uniref:L-threonine aldolase n=1 Tax=Variibacter gotjawalensis TaxID=1333996 RepID=A0A0S3PPA1_9BRAD|nr:low specificity L-threonine aldolase [Variibacter gotjawalensis]NIK48033.1 threonine aldolase [Variibacter gotjawalensis]RZS49910.1 L-threonine aldolase [Variibacter gotjawalensis]BAT57738.1 low specificity L-threonine aldolase [Variibacter gotjawalensis]
MNFASDNTAGIPAPILDAITAANEGYSLGYGNDDWTKRVEARLSELFEREVAAFLVPTGTVANSLALAHLSPPWGAVLCHVDSHVNDDESGAPEFFGGGLKLLELPGQNAKIDPAVLTERLSRLRGAPHSVLPSVVSITQSTELGTVYSLSEIAALAEIARSRSLKLHMDGARFGNAIASLGCAPAEATWKTGVDALSFGATKGGALAAEAIVFFNPADAAGMSSRRKRGGALISKHRFIAAQFEAYLKDDLWLKLARHANAMAKRLSDGLSAAGEPPMWPVEANEVFAILSNDADARLRKAGAAYYPWQAVALPEGRKVPQGHGLFRLVTSFATRADDVDAFLRIAHPTKP